MLIALIWYNAPLKKKELGKLGQSKVLVWALWKENLNSGQQFHQYQHNK